MGIFDALTTAVSGLQAQSFALQNISGNIANSQTASSGVCQPGIVPTPRDTERLAHIAPADLQGRSVVIIDGGPSSEIGKRDLGELFEIGKTPPSGL